MASTTSDTGDTSSKQQQAQRKENYHPEPHTIADITSRNVCVCVCVSDPSVAYLPVMLRCICI